MKEMVRTSGYHLEERRSPYSWKQHRGNLRLLSLVSQARSRRLSLFGCVAHIVRVCRDSGANWRECMHVSIHMLNGLSSFGNDT